jgi:branched-chain amino acid transport system substrate-binding protein
MLARRWFLTISGATLLGAFALGCGNGGKGAGETRPGDGKPGAAIPAEWKVGAYLSLSGAQTEFGTQTREGIELAVEEINKTGGPKGKPMKVLYEDDKSNPQEASNKVLQLITRDKVVALLGEVASSRSKAGGIVATKHKVPMITPSSTNPDVTQVGPFVFRVCFTDDVQGQLGARFAVQTLGKKRIAILYATDELYASGLASEFEQEAKKLGAEIVAKKGFLQTETNFTTYINDLKSANPDIIYAPNYYNHMVLIARQAKAVGLSGGMFLGGDGWDGPSLLTDAGDEIEGAYFTNHYASDVPWENSRKFVAAFKAKHEGREPSSLAAMGYDAALVLADAIGRARDASPESIRDAIAATKNFPAATGTISFDAQRNADKPIVVVQIKDKKFAYHSTVGGGGAGGATAPAATGAPADAPAPK